MEDIALKGRDFAGYLKLLPGVIDTRNREAPGWENMNNLSINGRTSFNFSVRRRHQQGHRPERRRITPPRRSIRSRKSRCRRRTSRRNTAAARAPRSASSRAAARRTSVGRAAYYKRDQAFNGNEYLRRQQCDSGQTAQCDAAPYTFDNGGMDAWRPGAHSRHRVQPRRATNCSSSSLRIGSPAPTPGT